MFAATPRLTLQVSITAVTPAPRPCWSRAPSAGGQQTLERLLGLKPRSVLLAFNPYCLCYCPQPSYLFLPQEVTGSTFVSPFWASLRLPAPGTPEVRGSQKQPWSNVLHVRYLVSWKREQLLLWRRPSFYCLFLPLICSSQSQESDATSSSTFHSSIRTSLILNII